MAAGYCVAVGWAGWWDGVRQTILRGSVWGDRKSCHLSPLEMAQKRREKKKSKLAEQKEKTKRIRDEADSDMSASFRRYAWFPNILFGFRIIVGLRITFFWFPNHAWFPNNRFGFRIIDFVSE